MNRGQDMRRSRAIQDGRMPAFAKWAHIEPVSAGTARIHHGPHRVMPEAQAARVASFAAPGHSAIGEGILDNVDAEGVATVIQGCGHYAPIIYTVQPDGSTRRIN